MDFIDIVSLLNETNLERVKVIGRVVSQLPKPSNLYNTVELDPNGVFARMHVFAVDLSFYKTYLKFKGYEQPDNIFMVNGSISIFINPNNYKLPDWYQVEGTLRFGTKSGFPYLTMFNFKKLGGNTGAKWRIEPNILEDVHLEDWHDTLAYRLASQSKKEGKIVLDERVAQLPEFFATIKNHKPTIENTNQQVYEQVNNVAVSATPTFKKESRSEILKFSPVYYELLDLEQDATEKRNEFKSDIAKTYTFEDSCTPEILYLVNAIKSNFSRKATPNCFTGRILLKNYLSTFSKLSEADYNDMPASEYLLKTYTDMLDFIKNGHSIIYDGVALKLCEAAFGDPEKFYAYIIGKLTGVSTDSLMTISVICANNNISFSKLVNGNPYLLQCIGDLSFTDVETIAEVLNLSQVATLQKFRNIAMLDSYFNGSASSNTVFRKNQLVKEKLGVSLTNRQMDLCKKSGTYISDLVFDNVKLFIKDSIVRQRINIGNFEKSRYGFIEKMPYATLQKTISDYEESGMGVSYKENVTSTIMLKKELYVYKYMHNLGSSATNFTDEELEQYIKEYEEIVGFELEEKQKEAVHLLKWRAGLVSGGAGSGKTTTSNCFVYALNRHTDDEIEIKFATPTGKAAKRMQEVVKQPVKTMCSMFKVGGFEGSIFDEDEEEDTGSGVVYMFDENAMVTLDLLYSCLRKIHNSSIYLFGDFNQLPPIGKGLPFKNLLRFMPCVFLNVSKRAKDGSNITKNSDIINNYSESSNWQPLSSGDDFLLYDCNEDTLADITVSLCKHYLGKATPEESKQLASQFGVSELPVLSGLTADDIQVVTPLSKSTYKWGATHLNRLLQPIFNPIRGFNSTIAKLLDGNAFERFIIGDRVIHTNSNMYSMQWYSTHKNGEFKKTWGFGISNGEVGRLVGFYNSATCTFEDEDKQTKPSDFEYPNNLRDDSDFYGDGKWFVVVEYYDHMSEQKFYILYRCEEDLTSDVSVGRPMRGTDLSMLGLFYAGTTHKMQGSQARLIISPLGIVNYSKFITRNMMYTLYTRGISQVFTFGSVGNNYGSMLSRARRETSDGDTFTIGELLV